MLKENTVYSELNGFLSILVGGHLIPSNRTKRIYWKEEAMSHRAKQR